MKNLYLKPLLMTGLMLPSLAMAAGPSWTIKLKNMLGAQSQVNQQLNKASGLSIGSAPLSSIESAINTKLGGSDNVNIDLGKAGGVLVGSGADGLFATSNESTGGPLVIHPPVFPQTSVTVVGRVGAGQDQKICARLIITDAQGQILKNQSRLHEMGCANLGIPIHLEPGKYLLEYSRSYVIIDLASLENKVVPLREVSVANVNGKYSFTAHRENCSLPELEKTTAYTFAYRDIHFNHQSPEEMKIHLLEWKQRDPRETCLFNSTFFQKELDEGLASGKDGEFFSVFPGVYKINWILPDGQTPSTRNITIE